MEESAAVVERAVRGDRDAWAQIWDEHAPALHRYARRMLDQDSDAADAVADTFVAAAEHLPKLRDPDALRPWLYAICKREIQRQWRGRDRIRPVEHDVLVAIGDQDQAMTTEISSGLDASEAATLIWEAAEGLSAADRELLALTLTNDLDSAAVAKVAGVSPQSIHVKVSRLKDSLGKAAGALLLARRHRSDCDELQAVLTDWDGIYTTVWRKRIARHIEGCAECTDRQRVAAGALFALAPAVVLVLPGALRESVLDRVSAISSAGSNGSSSTQSRLHANDFEPGGFVRVQPWLVRRPARRRRRAVVAALAALIALSVVALLLLIPSGSRPTLQDAAATTSPSSSSPLSTQPRQGSTSAPVVAPPLPVPTPSPEAPASSDPTPEPTIGDEPDTQDDEVASEEPSIEAPPPPLPAAPQVTLSLSPSSIQTVCGPSITTSVASTIASGAGVTTIISWTGIPPGSASFAGPGQHDTVVGPYAAVGGVTVTATTTDQYGRMASASQPLTVTVPPCPG